MFDNDYFCLIDYAPVPGKGSHEIGAFGIPGMRPNERQKLRNEGFDMMLEKALDKFSPHKVSYKRLETIRRSDSQV